MFPKARVAELWVDCLLPAGGSGIHHPSILGCGCPPDIFTSVCYPYDYEGSLEERIYQKKMTKVDNQDFLLGADWFLSSGCLQNMGLPVSIG